MNKAQPVRVRRRALPRLMFPRSRPQTPAPRGGVTAPQDEPSDRRAETNGSEPHGLLEYGWGWHYGELVCPVSWLLAMSRSRGPRPEEGRDDD
jgi:hypothetical protein